MNYFEFIHLRTPLQSLNKAYTAEKELTGLFKEGLFLASSEYWEQYQRFQLLNAKEREKINSTFNKYWLRSCSRCTPFGTFAGSALIEISNEETNLVLREETNFRRVARLDMNYLFTIIRKIEKIPSVEKQVTLFKNNSIYCTLLSYRYAEYSILNNQRQYKLVSVERNEYIDKVLEMASKGANIIELSNMLADFTESTYEEAYEFIKQMWESQLLVSDLEPSVTGSDPFCVLQEKLDKIRDIPIDLNELFVVTEMIKNISSINSYIEIENRLKQIFQIPLPKNTIQVDLFLSLKKNKISKSVIDSVFAQLNELMVFARLLRSASLDEFKTKFLEKFEEQEIPLNIALDAELGVGYSGLSNNNLGGSDWIDEIVYSPINNSNQIEFDAIQKYSLNKYHEYIKESKEFIEIKTDEMSNFRYKDLSDYYPSSMYLMGALLKKNKRLDGENFLFDFQAIGGPSGGNLLGRFTFGDEDLERFTKQIIKNEEEENPDVIYAEIAHLPEERIGNILLRPLLRTYEIPYLGRSGASSDFQIQVEDLMIKIVNNEIILRSKKLNKRVIPKLTTAHNFSGVRNLPIYRFLCDLQYQGIAHPIIWDWGILKVEKHLPRVVYKNIIVKKARWLVNIKDIYNSKSSKLYSQNELVAFFKSKSIPDVFVINSGDNKLLISTEEKDSIDIFINNVKKYKEIEVEEFLFNCDNCIVTDSAGNPFSHELIIPFRNSSSTIKKHEFNLPLPKEIIRKYPPGSEWLFFKIYCGSKIAEDLLTGPIYNFIENGLNKDEFKMFFFIRYKDPEPHLRIRFFHSDIGKLQQVLLDFRNVLQPYLDNEIIHSIVLDTYTRELERYGMEFILGSERLFFYDSLATIRIIRLLDPIDNENYRIILALRGIDQLLDDFNYNLHEKLALLRTLSDGMLNRFGEQPNLRSKINAKYKQNQKNVFAHMNRDNDVENNIEEAISIFDSRSEMNSDIINAFYNEIQSKDHGNECNKLLPSFIHMFVNRFFIAQQLKYELLVYVFLERYYTSILAIKKKANDTMQRKNLAD